MRTFSVKNFERFQHYKDRSPPWIKLYNELLDDYEFGLLPDASKFHLVAIWLLASRSENKIPYDPAWVSRRINASGTVNLTELAQRGFILLDQELQEAEHVASTPQSECLSREEGQVQDIDGGGVERAREPERGKSLIDPESYALADKVLTSVGHDPNGPLSIGAAYTMQSWRNGGWSDDCILAGVKLGMQSRRGAPPETLKYFEKAIARLHAEPSRAVTIAEIQPQETINVSTGQVARGSGGFATIAAKLRAGQSAG